MTGLPKTSAVVAGLLGASALDAPARAYGFALTDVSRIGVLTGDFLLGLVAGAASCGAVALAVSLAANRDKSRAGAHTDMDKTTTTPRRERDEFKIQRAQPQVDASNAWFGEADVPQTDAQASKRMQPAVPQVQPSTPQARRAMRVPEIDSTPAAAHEAAPEASTSVASAPTSHIVTGRTTVAPAEKAASHPRHLRERVPEVERKTPDESMAAPEAVQREKKSVPVSERAHASAAPKQAEQKVAPTQAQRVAQKAAPKQAPKPASKPAAQQPSAQADQTKRPARHEATDYADIATNYVRRQTMSDRAKSRARGVKALLAERMSRGMFDDLPVIQRADGTVGDVGTDWWNFKMGNSVKNDFSDLNDAAEEDDFTIDMTGEHNKLQSYKTDDAPLEGAARIAYISQRIAQVDEGVFPEHRDPEELDSEDLWDLAMKSMEKRGRELPQAFERITADSAEDKREQEAPTQVIPFRVPAGHPEVVDTATYVDYLISQEFDKNSSQAVRQTSRDYLRVIEGGSQSSQPTVINVPKRKPRTGAHTAKHMAPAQVVQESESLPLAKEA